MNWKRQEREAGETYEGANLAIQRVGVSSQTNLMFTTNSRGETKVTLTFGITSQNHFILRILQRKSDEKKKQQK
jgi:hypothetical protein